jgi:hypothetical protein
VAPGRHPIETTRYLLGTQVIDTFQDTVCQWIDNRAPGGMIYGKPRYGKTRAIRYLCKALPAIYGDDIPIISYSCRDYRDASESAFFEDLLRAAGHSLFALGNSAAKRDRLREFLFEKVDFTEQDRLILFLDEAQKLHEQQYKWLIDLHNELDELGINFITLLVGQPELMHQYSAFKLAGKMQVIGRFMVHQHEFHGVRNCDDVEVCLNGYDDNSEHPVGSSWSFTRYFYPAIFNSGWRLSHSSEDLWESFLQTHEKYGFVGEPNIPMQFFCRTVEHVLRRFGTLNEEFPNLSIKVWKEAIKCSGYVEAEERYAVAAT